MQRFYIWSGTTGPDSNNRLEQRPISLVYIDMHFPRKGFPGGSGGKMSACNVGNPGSIPGSGRSPGEGNGNPLRYSCLENPMDGEAW